MYTVNLRKRSIYKWSDSFETESVENFEQQLKDRIPDWVPLGSVAIKIRPDSEPAWADDFVIFGKDDILEMPKPDQDVPDYLEGEVVESKRQYYDFHFEDWIDNRLYYNDEDAIDGVHLRDKRQGLLKVTRQDGDETIWKPEEYKEAM